MSGNIPCFQSPWTNTLPESTRLVHKYILLSFVADKVKSCSLVCTDTPVSVNSSTQRQQVLCGWTQNKVSQDQVQALRYANASHIKVSARIHHILSLHTTHTYLRLHFRDYSEAFNTMAPSKLIVKALTFRFQAVHIGTTKTGVPQGCVLSPPFYSFIQTWLCARTPLSPSAFIRSFTQKSGPDLDASDPHHHWNSYTVVPLPPQTEETWIPYWECPNWLNHHLVQQLFQPQHISTVSKEPHSRRSLLGILHVWKWHFQNFEVTPKHWWGFFFHHIFTNAPPTSRLADYWNCNLMSLL